METSLMLHLGDCLYVMRQMPDCSVDAIVTDPPYGLAFMGKRWDYDVPSVEIWQECLRLLKPGGHLLAFAGTRTQHRMTVRIEDAGFEIRDMIAWVYGSGFPKSLNLTGDRQGWGTALKPALEPITMARKPLVGTVADNVQQHGTGAVNIDGCRVAHDEACKMMKPSQANIDALSDKCRQAGRREPVLELKPHGRWPANLIHDGSPEVVGLFPVTGPARAANRGAGINGATFKAPDYEPGVRGHDDAGGSAARFFYCAKASKTDRGIKNNHPTVKPTDLMRYLCRLVTPPGGIVLDPFMGSGSTGKAAKLEGFQFIGIEREQEYFDIAQQRINNAIPEQSQLDLLATAE